ncbi:MAG: hypothetical protein QM757_06250, partial [Paludibaculum sp.]
RLIAKHDRIRTAPLQTAFTLSREGRDGRVIDTAGFKHWDPAHRGDHEGYVAGYFLEAAINHYLMTIGRMPDCTMRPRAGRLLVHNLGPRRQRNRGSTGISRSSRDSSASAGLSTTWRVGAKATAISRSPRPA